MPDQIREKHYQVRVEKCILHDGSYPRPFEIDEDLDALSPEHGYLGALEVLKSVEEFVTLVIELMELRNVEIADIEFLFETIWIVHLCLQFLLVLPDVGDH